MEQHHPFLLYGQSNDATDTLHVIYPQNCFPIRSFITLAENFGKWRPYLELFGGHRGGQKFQWGHGPLPPPHRTAPEQVQNIWVEYIAGAGASRVRRLQRGMWPCSFKWNALQTSAYFAGTTANNTSQLAGCRNIVMTFGTDRYSLIIKILAYPTCIRHDVWYRETRMMWLPDGETCWR